MKRQGMKVEKRKLLCAVAMAAAAIPALHSRVYGQCVSDGSGAFLNANGDTINVTGGQVNGAGATLFVDFFLTPSSTNDWIDADGDGIFGFDLVNNPFPFVDQLATKYNLANLNSWWSFQYRSVGSVRGFEEYVEHQTCDAIPRSIPSEAGVFNGLTWALTGVVTYSGTPDNPSGTPLEPCGIDFSFLDVPSKWAVQIDGTPNWNRTPGSAGYGLNPIPSSTGNLSQLQSLGRTCGTCSGGAYDGEPCTNVRSCPGGTCVLGGTSHSLNNDTANPDTDTIFDYAAAWVPVSPITNRGSGVMNLRYTELQHLFVTGRMPNGENLTVATRDVGSGTRNAEMNSLGIDTSWGSGDNIGPRVNANTNTNLGPNTQPTNCGGSSIMENSVEQRRLAVGYTGLGGGSRAAADAAAGRYEILNVCKDVPGGLRCTVSFEACQVDTDCPLHPGETCEVVPPCDCDVTGYVRPSVTNVLQNCDPCNSFTLAGAGSFVARGDIYGAPAPANTAVSDYLLNIFDSIASFDGGTEPGECSESTVCSNDHGISCVDDSPCLGGGGTCVPEPCSDDSDCTLSGTDLCRLKQNMPGEILAQNFFLLNALDCFHDLTEPLRLTKVDTNVALQTFVQGASVINVPAFGSVSPAGRTPVRNTQTAGNEYSDGSLNTYTYWNGGGYSQVAGTINLSQRNRLTGDFNRDCVRDINDAAELVAAYDAPRTWQTTAPAQSLVASATCIGVTGAVGGMSKDNAIPEVMGDFDGDGNLNKEDLRYWADGLAMPTVAAERGGPPPHIDRKAGAIAIDGQLLAKGHALPWADTRRQVLIPPPGTGTDPTFDAVPDVDDPNTPFLVTGKTYVPGDFRADVAGGSGSPGGPPTGWDGVVDGADIDYCFGKLGDWTDLDQAATADLSCDMNGDLLLDQNDIDEIVETILGTSAGDTDLDGDITAADRAACLDTIDAGVAGCNGDASCGWSDCDFNGDGIVDNTDLDFTSCPLASAPSTDLIFGETLTMNRSVAFSAGDPGLDIGQAIRVTIESTSTASTAFLVGSQWWVQAPTIVGEFGSSALPVPGTNNFHAATLGCAPAYRDWAGSCVNSACEGGLKDGKCVSNACVTGSNNGAACAGDADCPGEPCTTDDDCAGGILNLYGEQLVAGSTYTVEAISEGCDTGDPSNYAGLPLATSRYGDVAGTCTPSGCEVPDGGDIAVADALAILAKFGGAPSAMRKMRADIEPSALDFLINVSDVLQCLRAFSGLDYPYLTCQVTSTAGQICFGSSNHEQPCATDLDCRIPICP